MVCLSFEDMRNMNMDDFKALNELKKMSVSDDLIQEAIKNTVEKNKVESEDKDNV